MSHHNALNRSNKARRQPLVRRPLWFVEGDEGQQLEREFRTIETPKESDFVAIARRNGLTPNAVKTYYNNRTASENASRPRRRPLGRVITMEKAEPNPAAKKTPKKYDHTYEEILSAITIHLEQVKSGINTDPFAMQEFCRAYGLDEITGFLETEEELKKRLPELASFRLLGFSGASKQVLTRDSEYASIKALRHRYPPSESVCFCEDPFCNQSFMGPFFAFARSEPAVATTPNARFRKEARLQTLMWRQKAKNRGLILVNDTDEDEGSPTPLFLL